jgi:hypothetical protein
VALLAFLKLHLKKLLMDIIITACAGRVFTASTYISLTSLLCPRAWGNIQQ